MLPAKSPAKPWWKKSSRPRLNEIFELIKAELIKAGMGGKTPAGLVLTGGGSLTYGVTETARKILNMQARIATPSGLTGLVDEIKTPEYSTVSQDYSCIQIKKKIRNRSLVSKCQNSPANFLLQTHLKKW